MVRTSSLEAEWGRDLGGAGDNPRWLVNTWTRLFWRADVGPEIDDRMPKKFSCL